MYKHNPLPASISKFQIKKRRVQRKNIVFSSPKIKHFIKSEISKQKSKMTKSTSIEKSLHRLDSKQKPKMATPSKDFKSFDMSTVEPYHHTITTSKTEKQNKQSLNYFTIENLLRQKQKHAQKSCINPIPLKSSLKNNNYNSIIKIQRVQNQDRRTVFKYKRQQKMKNQQNSGHEDLKMLIDSNYWQKYEGQTLNDKFHGYGALYFINGSKFMGFYLNNYPHGHGTYYSNDSQPMMIGIWENGKLTDYI